MKRFAHHGEGGPVVVEAGEVVDLVVLASVLLAAVRDVEIFRVAVTLKIAKVVSEVESKVRVRRGGLLKAIVLKATVLEAIVPEVP